MEVREFLFTNIENKRREFTIISKEKGVLSGTLRLKQLADELKIEVINIADEAKRLNPGDCVLEAIGNPEQIIRAEEMLLGVIAKPSGIATAAADLVQVAGDKTKVVCGGWKKVAPESRADLRQSIIAGGAGMRITDQPFVYLDKNYVRLLDGVGNAVARAKAYKTDRIVVVQIRGETRPIFDEATEAVEAGAGIVMVDTGKMEDLEKVIETAIRHGWRNDLRIAFAGGVNQASLKAVADLGGDIVCVGRAIIDAPLLDLSLDIR
ncbi:nicotinate-nucleotide pyrophosphorylase [Petroclostridium sp. X23]|uniref:nicotinate-nucleotide pyrophosphorylase n=1 Tax=Petroclostridium sp. X23 TaxID=3045146 RepID=UPI0024ADDB86|nr:nicotinate-nucleotide pyrophosphorylase [Petroclostridium sp. X23]WHH59258.1 nicotinate-nucleotide pyrophosphorylase [Petroclostridium sp. X23]